MSQEQLEVKAVMLGGGGVGKSCLVIMLIQNHFAEFYDPTIEDSYRKQLNVDGRLVLIDVLDTGGREEFSAMRDAYIRSGELFYLVCSLTSAVSLTELIDFRSRTIVAKETESIPMVIMANKVDLIEERQISPKELQDLAHSWSVPVFETSAKERINVEESFHAGLREAFRFIPSRERNWMAKKSKPSRCELM